MSSRELMQGIIIRMLNASLKAQGIGDVQVDRVSPDFRWAHVVYFRKGRMTGRGTVAAQTLLPGGGKKYEDC